MEKISGFIVRVKPLKNCPVFYMYNGVKATLNVDEEFIGYFWQATNNDVSGNFMKAHIQKTVLVDPVRLVFQYEGEAVFDTDNVIIEIIAKRGPDLNNKYLSNKFDKYDTWNLA